MTRLKIKDKTALINIFKTISWLDYRRWDIDDNYNFVNFFKDDLTNCEKILTHWVCYITDRQMPFEIVWNKGGYVFSELIYEYSRSRLPTQQILDKYYDKYKDRQGKKRLWCCIRDYRKGLYHQIFNDAIREVALEDEKKLISKWKNLPMSQIELPGDVWNNSPLFRDNLFANVIDIDSIPKTWGMSKTIRELYNQLEENEIINDFYPEQFDITFDFVPRMCNKKLCNLCLFGKNGVELICIPTKDKYCPVALVSCGYIAKCSEENCILKEGISKGICRGELK